MGSARKGTAKERELVNKFEEHGWFARRAGASGGGTDSESYDVIAAKDGRVIVLELKYRDPDNPIYVDAEKVKGLIDIAKQFGGDPMIVARWKQDTNFYGYHPANCYQTDSGTYRLKAKESKVNGLPIPPLTDDETDG